MAASQTSWWIRLDPLLGVLLCVASLAGLGVIVGACICFQRRRKSLAISVNGKCAATLEDGSSPSLSLSNTNCKLLQNMNTLLCNGSLPRHAELPPTPSTQHANGGLPRSRNGSAATLPMRYSPVAAPRFEAQLSRSSQCDRELPPVPPPDGALVGALVGAGEERVTELEEEDDSQYDLIARAPTNAAIATAAAIAASAMSALPPAVSASSCAGSAASHPNVGLAASAASLPVTGGGLVSGTRSMASIGGSHDAVTGPGVGLRTLTSGTIDSDAGSEVDPLYACIKPSRHSINRLVGGSLHSTPLHGLRPDSAGGALPTDNQQHVYSFIRKQASSPIYQALPRSSHHLSLGRQSLRGSVESYASLGGGTGGQGTGVAPSIPDRGYGQSEVDLVERLRRQTLPDLEPGPLASAGSSPAVVGVAVGGRHRRRSQPGAGVLLRVAVVDHGLRTGGGGAAVDGRLAAAMEEERRHSQPALASDDSIVANSSSGTEAAPSSAVREASYQRVTVRESIASLRARNALPQTGPANNAQPGGAGTQSLSLTDDTSSLYERLDHPSASHRRSFGPREPLLANRAMAPDPNADFYAEISGDDEAYGEGDVVAALASGLRHSASGPLRLVSQSSSSSGGGPAVLPGSGADRVLNEMSGFRHIDSDLDVSQTGTPISARRGFARPLSPPVDCGLSSAAQHRRSLMTPLMERSIEGSLFDDGASGLDPQHYTGCYCTASNSSEYERLPASTAVGPATLARADSPLLPPPPEVMTDSGLSVGGGSLPVLLPSPPMMRPQRFISHASCPSGSGHHRGHSNSSSSAFHSASTGVPVGLGGVGADSLASSDYCRRDSSSGIASRASQASSMSSGSPPTSHPASPPFPVPEGPMVGTAGLLPMPKTEKGNRGGRLVTQLLSSLRRKTKPEVRRRTNSDSSSIL